VVDHTVLGVDTLAEGARGALHVGANVSYTHDPLLLVGESYTVYGVERNRLALNVGGAWQPTRGLTIRGGFPVLSDWGTQVESLAAQGVGIGDLWLGSTLGSPRFGPLRLGAAFDVAIPSGTRDAWRGEAGVRLVPGVLADLQIGRLSVVADAALVARSPIDTEVGLEVGMEVRADGGVAWEVWTDRARVTLAGVTRTGLSSAGAGANSAELVAGVQLETAAVGSAPGPRVRLDGWVGRGVNIGYGASDYRVGLGISAHFAPKPVVKPPPPPEPPPPPPLNRPQKVDIEVLDDVPDERPPPPPEAPRARIVDDQIVIRDPIQFELATDRLLPESLPTLGEVAEILREHPEILQIVIEGHASEEGDYLYNYDLSLRRASTIFKELVLAGVHPERLACRSMGEVEPVGAGTEEAELARSRRVVFHITRRFTPGEPLPVYTPGIRVPWTGDPAKISEGPPLPEPPPPPEAEPPPKSDIPDRAVFEEEEEGW